ncbi:hypothetical protein PAPHI01_2657 [Pancytospora philotis]|nr:hypothetical protein PAPHI01_2657 [Pancytospora philotis]
MAREITLNEKVTMPMAEDLVKACEVCQQFNHAKQTTRQFAVTANHPFEKIGINLVGPLPETKRGNRYVIVLVDYL